MNCETAQPQLGALIDDELSPADAHSVHVHLSQCPWCRAEMESIRGLVRRLEAESPSPPEELWPAIEDRLDRTPLDHPQPTAAVDDLPGRASRSRRPLSIAAGLLLAIGVSLFALVGSDTGSSRVQASAVDFRVLLDALPLDAHKAFRKFLTLYQAKRIAPIQAKRFAPELNFEIPETLAGRFALQRVYLLRFGEHPGIAAEYLDNGELLATIFHPPVHPENYQTYRDHPCVVGRHRGHVVEVGPWRLAHLTDATTCHCVLSKLDAESELPLVMSAVVSTAPPTGVD